MSRCTILNVQLSDEEIGYLLEVLEREQGEAHDLLSAYAADRVIESPEQLLRVTSEHTHKYEVLSALKTRLEVIANGGTATAAGAD